MIGTTCEVDAMQVRACGEGPVVLLLHAGIADSRMWEPQFEGLGDDHRLIAPDLRGFGGSPIPNGPCANHEDLAGVLDHFDVERAWIVGVSYGAGIALDYALVSPQRVAGLVLVSPTLGGFQPSEEIRVFNQEEQRLLGEDDLDGATELNLATWLDGPRRDASAIDAGVRSKLARMQLEIFQMPVPKDVEFRGVGFVAMERLEDVSCPTHVVVGDMDVPAIIDHARDVADRIPEASFDVVPGAGHMLSLEAPALFNDLLRGLLDA